MLPLFDREMPFLTEGFCQIICPTGLPIREDANGSVFVAGLRWLEVSTLEEMGACLRKGAAVRVTGLTQMNARSASACT